jgi:hypothetical protein
MRSELIPQMLVILEHNTRHSDRLGLFEFDRFSYPWCEAAP